MFPLLPSPCINCTIQTPNKSRVISRVQFSPYLVLGLWSSSDSLTSSLTADSWNSESFESSLLTWKRKQHLFPGEDHCKGSRAPHCTTNCWRTTSTAKAYFTPIVVTNSNKKATEKKRLKFKHKLSPGGWLIVPQALRSSCMNIYIYFTNKWKRALNDGGELWGTVWSFRKQKVIFS